MAANVTRAPDHVHDGADRPMDHTKFSTKFTFTVPRGTRDSTVTKFSKFMRGTDMGTDMHMRYGDRHGDRQPCRQLDQSVYTTIFG